MIFHKNSIINDLYSNDRMGIIRTGFQHKMPSRGPLRRQDRRPDRRHVDLAQQGGDIIIEGMIAVTAID